MLPPCLMIVMLPYPPLDASGTTWNTVPVFAALIGVPHDAPKSMPEWKAIAPVMGSVRFPNGLVIAPDSGRMKPLGPGVVSGLLLSWATYALDAAVRSASMVACLAWRLAR